jgi:hypothetical protein
MPADSAGVRSLFFSSAASVTTLATGGDGTIDTTTPPTNVSAPTTNRCATHSRGVDIASGNESVNSHPGLWAGFRNTLARAIFD